MCWVNIVHALFLSPCPLPCGKCLLALENFSNNKCQPVWLGICGKCRMSGMPPKYAENRQNVREKLRKIAKTATPNVRYFTAAESK